MTTIKKPKSKVRNRDLLENIRNKSTAALFIFPCIITLLVLLLYPFGFSIYISFFKTNLFNKWKYLGLDNYVKWFTSGDFTESLLTTINFTFWVVVGHLVLGLGFALLLNKKIRGRTFYRAILLLPWLLPEVVVANLWRFIFTTTTGLFNGFLQTVGLIDEPMAFLSSLDFAMPVVIFVCIWKGYPLLFLQLMAGLQTISEDLYEAAKIDGATAFESFWHVTLPGLRPTLSVALLLDTVWWFKHVTMIWILTQGGPGSATNVLAVNIYKTAFDFNKPGPASALAVIVFIICLGISLIYRRGLKAND